MPPFALDGHRTVDSPIHRMSAGPKAAVTLVILVMMATIPANQLWMLAPLAGVLVVGIVVSRVSWRTLLIRLIWLEPLVLGIAGLSWFQPDGQRVALAIITKSTLCLITTMLLALTTPFTELLRVLTRARVPAMFVTVVALLYRYLAVLVDEATRMRRARASRTFSTSRVGTWRALADLLGQLFVRSTERAERIYAAMCARGWR